MAASKTFKQKLVGIGPNNAWFFLRMPFDVKAVFGKARVPVKVTINGYCFRSTVGSMDGQYLVCVNKEAREAAKIQPGDVLNVLVEHDDQPRIVEAPPPLKRHLKKSGVLPLFEKLAYSHKKEFVKWVSEAKMAETRDRRMEKMAEMLRKGQTRS